MVRERLEGGLENVAKVMRRKGIVPPRNIPKVPEINPSCGFSLDIIQKAEREEEKRRRGEEEKMGALVIHGRRPV